MALLLLWPAASAGSGGLPQLVASDPPPGASVRAGDAVRVVLDLTRGAGGDPSSARVLVDGRDLTAGCAVRATRDVPPSRVELACPTGGLAVGAHRAELRLSLPVGGEARHAWTFTVQAAPP